MVEHETASRDAAAVYMDGARDAVESAQYNLDGGFYGVAVNRAYYAFFYAATALLLTRNLTRAKHSGVLADEAQSRLAVANARNFIGRCETYLAQEGFR